MLWCSIERSEMVLNFLPKKKWITFLWVITLCYHQMWQILRNWWRNDGGHLLIMFHILGVNLGWFRVLGNEGYKVHCKKLVPNGRFPQRKIVLYQFCYLHFVGHGEQTLNLLKRTKQEDKIGRVKRPTQTHSQWLDRETKPLLCDTQLWSLSKDG